jgi:hypothetical protein
LVWVELVPPTFWLDPAVVVETLLPGHNTSTFGMSPKVGCSEPSTMVERIYMGGWFLGGDLGCVFVRMEMLTESSRWHC